MTIWVLTIILIGSNGAAAIHTQEYESKITCEAANADIQSAFNKIWSTKDLIIGCTQK